MGKLEAYLPFAWSLGYSRRKRAEILKSGRIFRGVIPIYILYFRSMFYIINTSRQQSFEVRMNPKLRPMLLSFIGSPHHILSDCIRESRFQGVRQLFANAEHKFHDPVLDVYCPSKRKPVAFGDFIQVIKEAYPQHDLTVFSEEKNHFITVKLENKNITYCLYCVYDEPNENEDPKTHYYLLAVEREHKLTDAVRPNIDREIVVSAWKDYIKVIEESEEMARAF